MHDGPSPGAVRRRVPTAAASRPRSVPDGTDVACGVLRKWFGPRALLWHALMVGIVLGCAVAADWQIHRAASGNTLSYLYSVEWPVFAIMAIVGWWQLINEDPSEVEERKAERIRRATPRPLTFDLDSLRRELELRPELADAFPQLGAAFPELTAHGAIPLGPTVEGPRPGDDVGTADPDGDRPHRGGAPVTVAAGDGLETVIDSDYHPSDAVRAYNDHLAALAQHRPPRSWRKRRDD